MSPILDLQRRFTEIGRIRMGKKVLTKSGKTAPSRLDTWRLTSSNRAALEEAAALWGGVVEPWQDAPTPRQFELITATDILPIIVPPGPDPASQWYEQWNAGGATHRCDSVTNYITDSPCSCNPEKRACKVTTRASVALPDLPGLGVWRFESHGYNVGAELPQMIELIRNAAERGTFLAGSLRIEQRVQISGGTTKRFPVAVIDLEVTMRQLAAGVTSSGALPAPSDAQHAVSSGNVTPIARDPAEPLSRQLEAVNDPPTARERSNAAAPLPQTNVRPRPVEQAGNPASDPGGEAAVVVISESQRRRLYAIGREVGYVGKDQLRAVILEAAGTDSTTTIPRDVYEDVEAAVRRHAPKPQAAESDDEKVAANIERQLGGSTAYDHPNAP